MAHGCATGPFVVFRASSGEADREPAAAARVGHVVAPRVGGWQPSRSTEIAAVTRASCTACSSGAPAARPAHTAPANASPAPVVSTGARRHRRQLGARGQQHGACAPRVSTTRGGSCPAKVSSSVSLTIAMSNCATTSASIALRRRGVDDRDRAVRARGGDGAVVRGARRSLPGRTRRPLRRARGADQPVGAGQGEDLVLALRVDGDQRDAAVHPGDHRERRDVDAPVGQRAADEFAELVVAARTEEAHAHAEPGGGHGDVRALAARREQEAVAEHRLTRPR